MFKRQGERPAVSKGFVNSRLQVGKLFILAAPWLQACGDERWAAARGHNNKPPPLSGAEGGGAGPAGGGERLAEAPRAGRAGSRDSAAHWSGLSPGASDWRSLLPVSRFPTHSVRGGSARPCRACRDWPARRGASRGTCSRAPESGGGAARVRGRGCAGTSGRARLRLSPPVTARYGPDSAGTAGNRPLREERRRRAR